MLIFPREKNATKLKGKKLFHSDTIIPEILWSVQKWVPCSILRGQWEKEEWYVAIGGVNLSCLPSGFSELMRIREAQEVFVHTFQWQVILGPTHPNATLNVFKMTSQLQTVLCLSIKHTHWLMKSKTQRLYHNNDGE